MAASDKSRSFTLDEGEKVTSVMIYNNQVMAWGEVVTKEAIRVSTWMRTPMIPQYITLHEAQVLTMSGGTPAKPQSFRSLYLPSSQVIAFHIMPPARDPLDYEPNEPHRKMEPATALIGSFRFDGLLRMSTQTDLGRYLDVTKEAFTAFYEVEITNLNIAAMGVIRTSYVLLRRDHVMFSPRQS
jgi:hypothetical protein